MTNSPVWLVTGASRGIGAAIADRAKMAGCRVALLSRRIAGSEGARQIGENALVVNADISDPVSVKAAIETTIDHFGQLNVVINNAGLHLDVNLSGPFSVIQCAVPYLTEGSSIVNIGAVVGLRGFPGDSAYASSKAGLIGLTKALSIELARQDITVNVVIPGLVLTDMTSGVSEVAMEKMRNQIPLRRLGAEVEIAEVVYWVSQSRYMTGAVVPVDGGLLASFGVTGQ
jgi:3-oxoacyl-[acyl-carrier protein] reductase